VYQATLFAFSLSRFTFLHAAQRALLHGLQSPFLLRSVSAWHFGQNLVMVTPSNGWMMVSVSIG
jgi:hypothetical protein